jgi:hypothetical protein
MDVVKKSSKQAKALSPAGQAEMPLIEMLRATFLPCHKQICSGRADGVCTDKEVRQCNRQLSFAESYIAVHDAAVASAAVKAFAEQAKTAIQKLGNPYEYDHSRRTNWDIYQDCKSDCVRAMAGGK